MKKIKLNLIKFNEEAGKLVMDLHEWWTDVTTTKEYKYGVYFNKIDEFIDRLEDLRSNKVITRS